MSQTLTLISSLENACLTDGMIEQLSGALQCPAYRILYPKVASDFQLPEDASKSQAIQIAKNFIGDLPIDVVVQASENRRKKLFLADMDSTIIGQECIDELADEVGVKDQVATITEAAMNGEIDFEGALKDRVALLSGLEDGIVAKVIEGRITINKGAKEALAVMRANGTHTALVSGGFTVFASEIAKQVGFHEFHANILVSKDGKFNGEVAEPILGQQAKLDQLNRMANEKQVSLSETIAIGDGANDLPMLMNAGTGIAFHAKPTVAAQADVIINHGDLTSLLFVQGYTKADFETALA
jgi:phosphoserine phosphatase